MQWIVGSILAVVLLSTIFTWKGCTTSLYSKYCHICGYGLKKVELSSINDAIPEDFIPEDAAWYCQACKRYYAERKFIDQVKKDPKDHLDLLC
jgi:uncharacterized protein with PIN domain